MIFKQAFRIAFVTLIWKQYKAVIISTLLLFAFFFIVSSVHNDYLTATAQENRDRITFIYKWAAYAIGVIAYFAFHMIRGRMQPKKKGMKAKIEQSKQDENTGQDPFAAIRERKKLRSRAEFLMDENDPKR